MCRTEKRVLKEPMFGLWHFLHLTGAIVWIGGMVFALLCLQPAAIELPPAQRVPLMVASLGRFFTLVLTAIVVIWITGLMMIANFGLKGAPLGWHLMIGLAAIMTIIFLVIRFAMFNKAKAAVARGDFAVAAPVLGRVRQLVILNLVLGLAAVASVSLAV